MQSLQDTLTQLNLDSRVAALEGGGSGSVWSGWGNRRDGLVPQCIRIAPCEEGEGSACAGRQSATEGSSERVAYGGGPASLRSKRWVLGAPLALRPQRLSRNGCWAQPRM